MNSIKNKMLRIISFITKFISILKTILFNIINYYDRVQEENQIEMYHLVWIMLSQEKICNHVGDKIDLNKLCYNVETQEDVNKIPMVVLNELPSNDEMRKIRRLQTTVVTFIDSSERELWLTKRQMKEIKDEIKKKIYDTLRNNETHKEKYLKNKEIKVNMMEIDIKKISKIKIQIVKVSQISAQTKRKPIYTLDKNIAKIIETKGSNTTKVINNIKTEREKEKAGVINSMNIRVIGNTNRVYFVSLVNYAILTAIMFNNKITKNDAIILTIEVEENDLIADAIDNAIKLYKESGKKKDNNRLSALNKCTANELSG